MGHELQVVFFVMGIQSTVSVFGVTVVTNSQFGILPKIPVKTPSSQRQTDAVSEIRGTQPGEEIDQSQGFSGLVANIEVFSFTNHTPIDDIAGSVRLVVV